VAKPISLKVPTKTLIAEAEKAIALRKKLLADHAAAVKAHEEAKRKLLASVPTLIKTGKLRCDDDATLETEWRPRGKRATVGVRVTYKFGKNYKFPAEPEWDNENVSEHSCSLELKELEQAVRLLKMTEDAMVSTSTYNAISQYL
jgi:hypothetical protein